MYISYKVGSALPGGDPISRAIPSWWLNASLINRVSSAALSGSISSRRVVANKIVEEQIHILACLSLKMTPDPLIVLDPDFNSALSEFAPK